MRKRRSADRSLSGRLGAAGGALALRMLADATRRPVDSIAILMAAAASLIIVVNALFLQSGSHPAPFLANPRPPQIIGGELPRSSAMVPGRPAASAMTPMPVAVRHDDPIADLIGPSPRIAAVQRVLSEYGYGQIAPSGMLDDATSAAIEKFERARRLPVAGEVSERLMRELAVMVGHPVQ